MTPLRPPEPPFRPAAKNSILALVLALALGTGGLVLNSGIASGQSGGELSASTADLKEFVETPAIPGYEGQLSAKIRSDVSAFHPTTDNLGDVIVTLGQGAPARLIVAPIDEPGYLVSEITEDGYLRLQRLPRRGLPQIFNELYSSQPVKVATTSGNWVNGVVAGLSIHLQPGRANPPAAGDLENMYVDIGASSAAEVRKAGVDLLSPIVIQREFESMGYGKMAGASIGDRFGAAALVDLLGRIDPAKIKGTLTVAFVTQQWTDARGLQRILTETHADEMIYVGRLLPGGVVPGMTGIRRAPRREVGSGVLVGLEQTNGIPPGLATALQQLADANKIPFTSDYSAAILPPSDQPPAFPAMWAHLAIATAWHDTPAEIVDAEDLKQLEDLLAVYAQGFVPATLQSARPRMGMQNLIQPHTAYSDVELLKRLVPAYGPSNHERPVREAVQAMLPVWAKPETDAAGNLVLQVGTASAEKTPPILFVAHLDEIGFEVKSIADDGRLDVAPLGGMIFSFYEGHPALVHTSGGDVAAVMELPNGWDEPTFHWPTESGRAFRVDAGARSRTEAEKLGIKVGDSITIPKAYRQLAGTRANGRSFDDRVGCTALISAVWALGGPLKDRNVTFVWSTGEELGLVGATALAERLAKEQNEPQYVFAIDTFVSSDSPLESKRFADAEIGKGFVVRAVDDSDITPRDLVERVVKMARMNQIPVQYGITGGGNDGSAFLRDGTVDIALGWPLRYSHSPGEVIDTRDVEALSRMVALLAKSW